MRDCDALRSRLCPGGAWRGEARACAPADSAAARGLSSQSSTGCLSDAGKQSAIPTALAAAIHASGEAAGSSACRGEAAGSSTRSVILASSQGTDTIGCERPAAPPPTAGSLALAMGAAGEPTAASGPGGPRALGELPAEPLAALPLRERRLVAHADDEVLRA